MAQQIVHVTVKGVPVRYIHVNDADCPEFWLATVGCTTRRFQAELDAATWILELVERHRAIVTNTAA